MTTSTSVAIVGAGIAGLCCARACLEHGLSVTLFDQRNTHGGIWDLSGSTPVFDGLRTNTACFTTALSGTRAVRTTSDQKAQGADGMTVGAAEFSAYVGASFAPTVAAVRKAHFGATVLRVRALARPEQGARAESPEEEAEHPRALRTPGYRVTYCVHAADEDADGTMAATAERDETFDYVVIATGYQHTPYEPVRDLPGFAHFRGAVLHSCEYRGASQICGGRWRRVLIVGSSISAGEIAGDLLNNARARPRRHVALVSRKPRAFLAKQRSGQGVFVDSLSSRIHFLRLLSGRYSEAERVNSFAEVAGRFDITAECGAPVPEQGAPSIVSSRFPALCAAASKAGDGDGDGDGDGSKDGKEEDGLLSTRLEWKNGGISHFDEDGVRVHFNDGSAGEYDALISATGYELHLPFLEASLQATLLAPGRPRTVLNLHAHTFSPSAPGMAFVGLYALGGSALATYDAQSRWVARVFAEPREQPTLAAQHAGVEAARRAQGPPGSFQPVLQYEVNDAFARGGGFDVDLAAYSQWTKALLFGPLVPAQFRLFGPFKCPRTALPEFERQIAAAGFRKGDNSLSAEQRGLLRKVRDDLRASGNTYKGFERAVDYILSINADT